MVTTASASVHRWIMIIKFIGVLKMHVPTNAKLLHGAVTKFIALFPPSSFAIHVSVWRVQLVNMSFSMGKLQNFPILDSFADILLCTTTLILSPLQILKNSNFTLFYHLTSPPQICIRVKISRTLVTTPH